MEKNGKIKRASSALFVAVCLLLLWFIIYSAKGLSAVTTEWNMISIAFTGAGALIVLATLIIALITLRSTKSDESPFNHKNVKRLKGMALLLVIYEPYFYIYQCVLKKLYPIVIDGITIETHASVGGIVLTAGLVVYCVALVFEYGISLQQQVDETL